MASNPGNHAPSNGSVYVCNLPYGTDDIMLAEYFGTIGLIKVWSLHHAWQPLKLMLSYCQNVFPAIGKIRNLIRNISMDSIFTLVKLESHISM